MHTTTVCLPISQYTFTITDTGKDGLCCDLGQGWYKILFHGTTVQIGGQFESTEKITFGICLTSCDKDPFFGARLDVWTGITGTSIPDLRVHTNDFTLPPIQSTCVTDLLASPIGAGDNYGSRMKGWLEPIVTGSYSFWIAASDSGEFWLSLDSDPANKVRVCYSPGSSEGPRFWSRYSEQKSNPISLVAGQVYYYEVRYCFFFLRNILCVRFLNVA